MKQSSEMVAGEAMAIDCQALCEAALTDSGEILAFRRLVT